jgi:alpha-D-xyloside xylohydrolase
MEGFRQEGGALVFELNHETVRIEPWGKDGLRVRATVASELRSDLPGALLDPTAYPADITLDSGGASIRNGALLAQMSPTGKLVFCNAESGKVLLEEEEWLTPVGCWPSQRSYRPGQFGLYHAEQRFLAQEGERFYGMGQQVHGRLNHKGCTIELLQRNTQVNIPFLISDRGYGFLWHNPAVGRAQLGLDRTIWVAEATHQLDYWITAGDSPAEILEKYVDATGHPSPFPAHAAGFWQCKLRYSTQEELLGVAREYRRRGLPLSVIVIDFFHWSIQGDWKFDSEKWPDPAAMVRELEEMGIKVMVSIWPTVNTLSENYAEMKRRGLLVRSEYGSPVHMQFVDNKPEGPVYLQYFDATNPEARRFVWERACENYYHNGIKIFWLDEAEPDLWPMDPANMRYHLGNGMEVTNLYPQLYARGFYEGMREAGETEILNLIRCAWAGSQRYGVAVWSGDIRSSWESLRTQVPAGLSMGLSGIPYWTSDIGGFFGGDPEDPSFRELVVRWFQFGAFCPLFRLHGYREPALESPVWNGGPNEAWSYGDRAYEIIKGLLLLRERLQPYIMEQMRLASEHGTPPMRPLLFDFPQDATAWTVEDEFMFGPDLLVAPVLHEGAVERPVYLPASTTWTDAWTGAALAGGQTLLVSAPLERIPLYLRGDAQLPIKA